MPDKSPKEIERMVKRAKEEDRKAEKAEKVVKDALRKAHPQREYRES